MEARAPLSEAERRERRAARARQLRRRRQLALGALVAALGTATALALIAGAGGGSGGTPTPDKPAQTAAKAKPKPVTRRQCLAPYRVEAAPILEYHVIWQAPTSAAFPLLYVPPKLFKQQMQAIKKAGYHAVTLDQLWANWHEHKRLPCGRPIVISFDNGYETQFQYAEPVLAKLGWVGVENLQLTGLDWANGGISHHELRELVRDGWELDTQGYNHADMVTESASGLELQTAQTRHKIELRFHVPVNWFCYPSGDYDPTVIDALKAAGFRGATTEVNGWARRRDDPYALPRLEVQPTMSGNELVQIVAGMRDDPPPGDSGAH